MKELNKVLLIIVIFSCIATSCSQKTKRFDFGAFESKGLSVKGNKKYLTWVNVHNKDYTGMRFFCNMYSKPLEPYINSQSVDVVFLIDADAKDSLEINEKLKKWCFQKYIVTYKTPDFFKLAKKQGVKGVSYLFDKDGFEIALTNPSYSNFKKLMEI